MPFQSRTQPYDVLSVDDEKMSRSSHSRDSEDETGPMLGQYRRTPSRLARLSTVFGRSIAVVNTTLLLIIATILLVSPTTPPTHCSEAECAARTSFYSPLLEPDAGVIEYEEVRFSGALEAKSIYKGEPSKEMDDAWNVLTHMNNSGVPASVIDRIGKDRISVRYPESQGGMYDVGIEVFHHMHCLNIIRQYTRKEYYLRPENRPESFTDSETTLRAHIDHCIEMLRQQLLCAGDVGLITYNWIKPWGMYPDFSTTHKCRKLEPIVAWADKHALPAHDPEPDKTTVYLSAPPP